MTSSLSKQNADYLPKMQAFSQSTLKGTRGLEESIWKTPSYSILSAPSSLEVCSCRPRSPQLSLSGETKRQSRRQDTKGATVTLGRQERRGTTCLQTSNTFLHNGPGCRSGKRGSSTPGMPVACQREQPVSLAESLLATSRKIRSGVAERASRESKNTRLPFQNPNLTTFFGEVPF